MTEDYILDRVLPEPNSGCWIWSQSLTPTGYGQGTLNSFYYKGHRLSYQIFKGPIEKDLHVLHKCDTPSCVNPDHLWLGTHKENMQDMFSKKRRKAVVGESHGISKLTADEVYMIRFLHGYGISMRKIGRFYKVSHKTISSIVHRKTWRHVP